MSVLVLSMMQVRKTSREFDYKHPLGLIEELIRLWRRVCKQQLDDVMQSLQFCRRFVLLCGIMPDVSA